MLLRERVRFYDGARGFGFIGGAKDRDGVYFNSTTFGAPLEYLRGELVLRFNIEHPHPLTWRLPERGDEIVFCQITRKRGVRATVWTFAEEWDMARRRISRRLSPDSVAIRVRQPRDWNNPASPATVYWEGEFGAFQVKVNCGFATQLHPQAVIEEHRATGWMPIDPQKILAVPLMIN
jgi:cold shock CspA family protein